jgi:hypothetical protein
MYAPLRIVAFRATLLKRPVATAADGGAAFVRATTAALEPRGTIAIATERSPYIKHRVVTELIGLVARGV